ncbi:copper resistance protein CopC [Paenibacillus sp. TRM 82003]|uniref:copper resistance CopC family protein n=1 Tax=Kineococcus sp. TRM81007 TaxID=2925831 RepID=UPI001F56C901|nr:copper resistance CopC family protein [Kineococcus sp. TRM81007]MCI2239969.1 copper resistance protein CopC [Kineococcus sp. TRM81007]MCI3925726.1 copper resistance protein CopC [Paenibacillus sp. TRM 82003]
MPACLTTHRPTHRRAARGATAVALALGASLAAAPGAWAHDRLLSTDPAADAVLEQAPEQVVLTMSAPPVALGTQVEVTGPTGVVSTGEPQVVDEEVTQALAAERPAGTYEVQWRVTSSDGHPISGSFTFTAETAAAGAAAATTAPTPEVVTSSPADGSTTAETSPAPDGEADPVVDAPGDAAAEGEGVSTGVVAAAVLAVVALAVGLAVVIARRRRRG